MIKFNRDNLKQAQEFLAKSGIALSPEPPKDDAAKPAPPVERPAEITHPELWKNAPTAVDEPPAGNAAEASRHPAIKLIVDQLFSYTDSPAFDYPKKRELLESARAQPHAADYAEGLKSLIDTYGLNTVKKIAAAIHEGAKETVQRLGVPLSAYGQSQSWAMWDIGKQEHYVMHPPASSNPNYEQKSVFNDYNPNTKFFEVMDRHIGWEVYDAFLKKAPCLESGSIWERINPKNRAAIEELLAHPPKRQGEPGAGTLPSYELAKLGALLRELPPTEEEQREEHRRERTRRFLELLRYPAEQIQTILKPYTAETLAAVIGSFGDKRQHILDSLPPAISQGISNAQVTAGLEAGAVAEIIKEIAERMDALESGGSIEQGAEPPELPPIVDLGEVPKGHAKKVHDAKMSSDDAERLAALRRDLKGATKEAEAERVAHEAVLAQQPKVLPQNWHHAPFEIRKVIDDKELVFKTGETYGIVNRDATKAMEGATVVRIDRFVLLKASPAEPEEVFAMVTDVTRPKEAAVRTIPTSSAETELAENTTNNVWYVGLESLRTVAEAARLRNEVLQFVEKEYGLHEGDSVYLIDQRTGLPAWDSPRTIVAFSNDSSCALFTPLPDKAGLIVGDELENTRHLVQADQVKRLRSKVEGLTLDTLFQLDPTIVAKMLEGEQLNFGAVSLAAVPADRRDVILASVRPDYADVLRQHLKNLESEPLGNADQAEFLARVRFGIFAGRYQLPEP